MPVFNPNRLTLARQRRGITKSKLAEAAGVAPRGITAYEAGATVPTPETLEKIAATLRFPPSFFEGDDLDIPDVEAVSFRAMSRMTASLRDSAIGAAALAIGLAGWIDARFRLPAADLPDLRGVQPEAAAEALRASWGLGVKPIRNMVHLLEQRGVRVFSLVEKRAELDAFSFWRSEVPFVFLNTSKSGERGRFDAAHELGHLVLHRHGAPHGREAEHEADAFASALLMPRASVLEVAPSAPSPSVDQLVRLKRRWSVSVAAVAHRYHALSLVSEWHYRSLCIEIQERGYRKKEPNAIARETSQVLQKVFASLREDGISKAEIARELRITSAEFDTLVFGLVLLPISGGEGTDRLGRPPPTLRLV